MPGMLAPQPFWILSLMGVLITKCNRLFQYWVALIIFIFELRCCIHSWNLNPFLVLILLCKITHMYPGETSVPSQSWLPIKTSLVLSFFKMRYNRTVYNTLKYSLANSFILQILTENLLLPVLSLNNWTIINSGFGNYSCIKAA